MSFQTSSFSIDNYNKILSDNNINHSNFCLVPFTTLILEPNGDVGVCRQKGSEFIIGNLKNNSIEEIWNNSLIKKWRKEFLDGNVEICKNDIRDKKCNVCPQNNQLLEYVEFSEFQDGNPIKLAANFNGNCNLSCQMCKIHKMPNGFYDSHGLWDNLMLNFFPYVKEIDFFSGEPFIQPDTFRLIEQISEKNPECKWIFTTNGHWKLSKKIEEYLNKIIVKNITFSIDSLDPLIYSKIRKKGNLSLVLNNVDNLLKYNEKRNKNEIKFYLNFLVQKDNWSEVYNILDFCEKNKISPYITYLYEPEEFSLSTLEESEKMRVLDFCFDKTKPNELNHLYRIIMPLLQELAPLNRTNYMMKLRDSLASN